MKFLSKLFGGNAAPDWAAPVLRPADYQRFMETLRTQFEARPEPHEVDAREGVIRVRTGETAHSLGLLNLAQRCAQAPQDEWPRLVRDHLDRLLRGTPETVEALNARSGDFNAVKDLLKVRLQPAGYAEGLGATVAQSVADDLLAVLVYDLPESVVYVHPNQAEKWGVPEHDLFQMGLRHVWADGPLVADRIDLGDGVWLDHYEDPDNHFGATHALLLHEYVQPEPEFGILVSVPTRHGMVIHPITGPGVRTALGSLFWLTPQVYEQGPGSVTTSVYWWRYGTLTPLPYQPGGPGAVDGSPTFTPPVSFREQVLDRLGAS